MVKVSDESDEDTFYLSYWNLGHQLLRQVIGDKAATKIQSCWRGFLHRQRGVLHPAAEEFYIGSNPGSEVNSDEEQSMISEGNSDEEQNVIIEGNSDSDECSATTEWLDENSCPRGHLGGQFGCDFCDYPGEPLAGTSNFRKFLKEQGWDKYDIRKHYKLSKKAKDKGTSSSKDKSDEQVLIIILFIVSLLLS